MGMTSAEILSASGDYDDFRERLLSLGGDFPFDPEEMMALGRVYFTRYPDTSDNRNMYNVSMGYRIVRLCIMEKVLAGIDADLRSMIHDMLDDMTLIEKTVEQLNKKIGMDGIEACRRTVRDNLDRIRALIDELPRGMIKERFVGGISKFYNELYLLNIAIEQMKTNR